ncbi:MAG: glycine--tRNA ligase [Methanobacteriota archaeon]
MEENKLMALAKRRGFFYPAFEIYGGVAGMYDYGPLGALLKRNVADHWRSLYILGEGCGEIDSPNVSPEAVFVASGHVAEFSDFGVQCDGCKESFRADHLLEGLVPNPDSLDAEALFAGLRAHGVKCPSCGGSLGEPQSFNLMFQTKIGPGDGRAGYLRPETAQAMFFNFGTLYRHFREALPFGVVQVGKGFRNEISPRQGMIRLREFNMMEAEIFVRPDDKSWPRFDDVKGDVLRLVPQSGQEISVTAAEAAERGVIKNEALTYFVALTRRFLLDVGVDDKRLRFRQHLSEEMAHYASDCWDAEIELSIGWTEAVGIADRGSYDLEQHIKHSGADLRAFERFDQPVETERDSLVPVSAKLGPLFKKRAAEVKEALATAEPSAIQPDGSARLNLGGDAVTVPADCFELKGVKEKVHGRRFVPHVIEPSYGLDRILYSVLEHAFFEKDDYAVLRLKAKVAPVKFGVFPLMTRDGLDAEARKIDATLRAQGMVTYYDDGGSIGRRYARMDEIGTPFCITFDYDSFQDKAVTIRDRDSQKQARVPIVSLGRVAQDLLERGPDTLHGWK